MATLEALATATPENRLPQATAREFAEQLVEAKAPERADVLDVFENAGIDSRAIARELPFYLSSPGWAERSTAFEEAGTDLAERVTEQLLAEADVPAEAIDGIVVANTTGVATPSVDVLVANRLGLRSDLERVPVFGWGCAGGVAGLSRTADLARANPDNRYLFLSLELCSLAFLESKLSKKMIVAAALFGDGCAGALVTGEEIEARGPRIRASASHLWPDTEGVMGWDVTDRGLDVEFSPEIPEIVESRLAEIVDPFLKQEEASLDETRTVFHPGGPKVLSAYERALDLDEGRLDASRQVLAENGNMSSPTALFALEKSLERERLEPDETALLAAVGPGFAGELALLEGS